MYTDTKGISSDNYVVVQGWMCNELDLKGNDLLVFALIYGFCQDGKSVFSGGRKYISETFNISLPTVDKSLQNLLNQQLIIKHSSGDFIHTDLYTLGGSKETLLGVVKKLYEGSKETLHNNTNNIKENTNSNFTNVKLEQPSVTPSSSKDKSLNHPKRTQLIDTVKKDNNIAKEQVTSNKGVVSPIKKKNLYEKCMDKIDEYTSDPDIKELLITYFKVRKEMGIPLYPNQWISYINDLKRLVSQGQNEREVIQQSINRGYRGFYEVKNYRRQNTDVFSECGKVKSIQTNEEAVNESF